MVIIPVIVFQVKIRVQRLAHPGFRLVEPKSLQLGERGDMDDYLYQQCSGVRCRVSGVRFSNRIRPAVSESLMKWTFFHRCWSSVATKSVFRGRYLLTPETLASKRGIKIG
jgi:hypothetical protein